MKSAILLLFSLLVATRLWGAEEKRKAPVPSEVLTLKQALSCALECNPELAAFNRDVRAADARRLQASLRPNPELAGDLENVAGSGAYGGAQAAELTLQLSQLFELGGKRPARIKAASMERTVAQYDYAAKRLSVLNGTAQAFIDVLGAQRRVALAEENLGMIEDFTPSAKKRVRAGRSSVAELARFDVAAANARIAKTKAVSDLAIARRKLAAWWGSTEPQFASAAGNLEQLPKTAPLAKAQTLLPMSPSLRRWQSEIDRRNAVTAMEKTKGVPDLTLSTGYRRLNDEDDNAFVLGFSIPLPFWNRNQGAIKEASELAQKADDEQRAALANLGTQLGITYQTLDTAKKVAVELRDRVIPQAQIAFNKTNEGYVLGLFSYQEVLDAFRALLEARQQYIEALTSYHKAVAEIEALTGRPSSTLVRP